MPRLSKKSPKYRSENFRLIDSLQFLCTEQGLALMGFEIEQGTQLCRVLYFNKRKMQEPKVEECRDSQDYKIRFQQWMTMCTEKSKSYPSFTDMIDGEIERLKKSL